MASASAFSPSQPVVNPSPTLRIGKEKRDLLRVAALVSVVVSVFLFLTFPHPVTVLLVPLVSYASYEIFSVMGNIERIIKEVSSETRVSWSQETLINQACENALISKTLFKVINFDVNKHKLFH